MRTALASKYGTTYREAKSSISNTYEKQGGGNRNFDARLTILLRLRAPR
jgi:hypothetical protein